ncbi:M56 family metallopeptidase [Saccharopolyspora sp. NPDC050389]|uniref:M56 family metallopeptidase n=1 Tax=Saccharopolyspora sp. NPDC050389 TaxID=3155516 RepID=UPI0033E31394
MTPLLIGLFAYTAALAALGPGLMRACRRWQSAAPRLGLILWATLATSWVVSVISAGLAAMAQLSGGLGLAGLLHACLRALLAIIGVHDLADAPAAIALLGSVLVMVRLLAVAAHHARQARRHRKMHRHALRSCSDTLVHNGIRIDVVETEQLAAYCVPGRGSTVVLTTGALRRLVPAERDAVIAHEIAHLRGKHHLVLGWAAILARAFPFVPLLKAVSQEIARLVEWIADDRAGRRHGNRGSPSPDRDGHEQPEIGHPRTENSSRGGGLRRSGTGQAPRSAPGGSALGVLADRRCAHLAVACARRGGGCARPMCHR